MTGKPLFVAPIGRTMQQFLAESEVHGWPSFRDAEVNWDYVRVLPNAERLRVDAKSTWPDVKKFAQQRSGHADFALEDEDGGRLGAQTPLAWIRADQQGRPYRRAVVKRRGVDADGVFERRGVVAPAHVGLVANTINAGMDTTTLLSESVENSVQHGATLVKIFIDPVRAQRSFSPCFPWFPFSPFSHFYSYG